MTADGPNDEMGAVGLEEAMTRLADARRVTAILETRLHEYQSALEAIHNLAQKALAS